MQQTPTISIIIPTLNEADAILETVSRASAIGDQVIVADGGSTDGTVEKLTATSCVVLDCEAGRGQQLATGAERADGNILLFLHADAELGISTRQQIFDAWNRSDVSDPETFWGCFEQSISNSKLIYRAIEFGNLFRAKYQRLVYGDQGMFVSRELYDAVKGVPKIPLMEDFEFSRRLGKIARPQILDGPIKVSARRWETSGPIRQTARNWWLAWRYRRGASPEELRKRY